MLHFIVWDRVSFSLRLSSGRWNTTIRVREGGGDFESRWCVPGFPPCGSGFRRVVPFTSLWMRCVRTIGRMDLVFRTIRWMLSSWLCESRGGDSRRLDGVAPSVSQPPPPETNVHRPSGWGNNVRGDHVVDVSQADAKPFLRRTRTPGCGRGPRGCDDRRVGSEARTRKDLGAPVGWKRVHGTSPFSVCPSPPSLSTNGREWCVLGLPCAIASVLVRVPPGSMRPCIVRKDERGRCRRRMDGWMDVCHRHRLV